MIDRVRVRLRDILRAMERIARYVDGQSLDAFKSDEDRQWLIERGVLIISEAVRHIPDHMTDAHPSVRWRDIRSIGNRLRHEYDRVDPEVIWSIARNRLPELRPIIEVMLADLDNKKPS